MNIDIYADRADSRPEIDNAVVDVVETQQEVDAKQIKLNSIQEQIVLIEEILSDKNLSPEQKDHKKKEIEAVLIKAKQEIALLKADTTLTDIQKKDLDGYQKKLGELESSIKPWYEQTRDWVKEKGANVIDYVAKNPGKSFAFVATLGIGYGLYRWFTRAKDTKEEKKDDTEKKPWYTRWYTWVGAGLAGFLGWKYRDTIKGWFDSLFGGEKSKKDAFGKEVAEALGADRIYDAVGNKFLYKSKEYKWDLFIEQGLIHTTMDADGAAVLDKEKTVAAIQEYVANDFTTQPDGSKLLNTEETAIEYKKLPSNTKTAYQNIGSTINVFYKKWHTSPQDVLGKQSYESDSGSMLYHLDYHYGNIGTLLHEDSFPGFRDATTENMLESIFDYFPKPLISALFAAAAGANIVGLDKIAESGSDVATFVQKLKPSEKLALHTICLALYNQWTAISYYVLAVRDAYAKRVDHDEEKLRLFETLSIADLTQLSTTAQGDEDILYAIEHPHREKDVEERIEDWNDDEKDMLKKLEKANTPEKQKKVIESLIGEIDDVGYHTWSTAFSLVWGHIWEKQSYLEYDVISQMYEEFFGDQKEQLQALLNKKPLTAADIQQVKQSITDFYGTMKKVSTQVELWQETDEQGRVTTLWKIPVLRAGKLSYQVFMGHLENDQRVLAGLTLAAVDLTTYPARKLLAMGTGRRFLSLSPTVWTLKKIGTPIVRFTVGSAIQAGKEIIRTPIRSINQAQNKLRFTRSMRFRNTESLFEAIQKSHITLDDAAKMLAGKSSGKSFAGISYDKLRGKNWRALGFGKDIELNKLQLLRNNDWVKTNILLAGRSATDISDDLAILAKYWDTKAVIDARRRIVTGPALQELLINLRKGIVGKGVEAAARSAQGVDRMAHSADDLSTIISHSQDEVTKLTKKVFADFEKELSEQALKKGLKPGSPGYKNLSKKIRESVDYGNNPKLTQALATHNTMIAKTEKTLLQQFNTSTRAQKQKLYADNPIVRSLVDANGGIAKRKVPGFGRTGRMISVGVHAVMLGWIGSGENAEGNDKDWNEVTLDAADFGLGMIPVAGGLYDIGMAFRGTDLNGRQMSGRERGIRGTVGLGTGILDVFTFGLGGTAIRAAVKGGTKLAVKAGTKKVATESVEVVSKGFTKGAAKQIAKSAGVNILVGTAAGLALIPAFDALQSVSLEDETSSAN